jgi:branched-chain amino acid transport system ATP-binding protein
VDDNNVSMRPLLEVKELGIKFGGLQAVNNIGFSVDEKQIVSIIGPNGSGKTTLFNLITGHYKPDSGHVIFDGVDIAGWSPDKISRMHLGRSFQRTSLFPRLSVFENIQVAVLTSKNKSHDLFRPAAKMFKDEVYQILETIDLEDDANTIAGSLPHGGQRRLEIGITVASQPHMILLDEPAAGLSPEETVSVTNLIKMLAREKQLTVLFIEHDVSVVVSISDRIMVLYQGEMIANDIPSAIVNNKEVKRVYLGEDSIWNS